MNKRIMLICVIMIFLINTIGVSIAPFANEGAPESSQDDYTKPDVYKNKGPSEWDYTQVKWEVAIEQIKSDPAKIQQIPDAQIVSIPAAQIKSILSNLKDTQIKQLDPTKQGLTGGDLATTANSQTILAQMSAEQKGKLTSEHLIGYTNQYGKITLPGELKEYNLEAMKQFGQTLGLADFSIAGSAKLEKGVLIAGKTSFGLAAFYDKEIDLPDPTIEVKENGVISYNGRGLAVGESMITAGQPDKGTKGIRLTIKPQPATTTVDGALVAQEIYKVAGHTIERKDKITEINLVLDGTTVKSIGATGTGSFTLENTETKAKLDCKDGKGYIMYDTETGITKYGFDGQDDGTATLNIVVGDTQQEFKGDGKNKFVMKVDKNGKMRSDLVGVADYLLREKQKNPKKVTDERLKLSKNVWTAKSEYATTEEQTPIQVAGKDYYWVGNGWLDPLNKNAKLISTDQLISAWEQGQKQKEVKSASPVKPGTPKPPVYDPTVAEKQKALNEKAKEYKLTPTKVDGMTGKDTTRLSAEVRTYESQHNIGPLVSKDSGDPTYDHLVSLKNNIEGLQEHLKKNPSDATAQKELQEKTRDYENTAAYQKSQGGKIPVLSTPKREQAVTNAAAKRNALTAATAPPPTTIVNVGSDFGK